MIKPAGADKTPGQMLNKKGNLNPRSRLFPNVLDGIPQINLLKTDNLESGHKAEQFTQGDHTLFFGTLISICSGAGTPPPSASDYRRNKNKKNLRSDSKNESCQLKAAER